MIGERWGAAGWGRGAGEFAAGEDDADGDDGAVELGFVHVRDGGFGGGGGGVDYVGRAAVGHDWSSRSSISFFVAGRGAMTAISLNKKEGGGEVHCLLRGRSRSLMSPYALKISRRCASLTLRVSFSTTIWKRISIARLADSWR